MRIVIFLILSTFFLLLETLSQDIQGKYCNNREYINFRSDSIDFRIEEGGLITTFCGNGSYEFWNDYLIVRTKK